jgi:stearoyl-CoA desaturase (delta-9 desaturase)
LRSILFSGLFTLTWWQAVAVALVLTHVTIVCVTVYLHRSQTHRALDLHPIASHFFRLWLWLTTGMVTREWVAVHRKHHAKCETVEDPHSPQVYGINRVLWGGVLLYVRQSSDRAMVARYGAGTPDDWLERRVYSAHVVGGLTLMAVIDLVLFGLVPGALIFVVQIAWIPFWAAGVINGVGHYYGYRNWSPGDASTNIVPWGILIGGEELHNNHHAYPTSAKLSNRWFEFDIGWVYIRLLCLFGLAKVKRIRPVPRLAPEAGDVTMTTLHAVIGNRHHVLAGFARALRGTNRRELAALRRSLPRDPLVHRLLENWMAGDGVAVPDAARAQVAEVIAKSWTLWTVHSLRSDLAALWSRSTASKEKLLLELQEWCRRAESSRIPALEGFSRELRRYI